MTFMPIQPNKSNLKSNLSSTNTDNLINNSDSPESLLLQTLRENLPVVNPKDFDFTVYYEVANMINDYDGDHDGKMSRNELGTAYGDNKTGKRSDNGLSSVILGHFDKIDANHDGLVTEDEIREVAKSSTDRDEFEGEGLYLTDEDFEALGKNADTSSTTIASTNRANNSETVMPIEPGVPVTGSRTTNTNGTSDPDSLLSQTFVDPTNRKGNVFEVDYYSNLMLNQYDTNHDGKMSLNELGAGYMDCKHGTEKAASQFTSILYHHFGKVDANHDGNVSIDEIKNVAKLAATNGERDGEGLYLSDEDFEKLDGH